MTSLAVTTSSCLDGATVSCSNGQTLPRVGGTTGVPFVFSSPMDAGLQGVRVRTGQLVNALGVITLDNGLTGLRGNITGSLHTLACGAGARVAGINGTTWSGMVESLGLICDQGESYGRQVSSENGLDASLCVCFIMLSMELICVGRPSGMCLHHDHCQLFAARYLHVFITKLDMYQNALTFVLIPKPVLCSPKVFSRPECNSSP